jgi:formylglycine-generating enzyme required for sulfatase activity
MCADVVAPSLAAVPGGSFWMGSESGRPDERPVRLVEVAPFLLGRTPVTNAEYGGFVEAGVAPPPFAEDSAFSGPRQPVVGVTWFEAMAYVEWLSATLGGRWRLPSEAEWERAARGGLEGAPTAWGDRLPEGEIPSGPLDGPWPVGHGTPNRYGLFDMGTIVHEWCLDAYPGEPPRRASRGGSWRHRVRWSPPSARSSLLPELRYADYGFRVLREVA